MWPAVLTEYLNFTPVLRAILDADIRWNLDRNQPTYPCSWWIVTNLKRVY